MAGAATVGKIVNFTAKAAPLRASIAALNANTALAALAFAAFRFAAAVCASEIV